MSSLSKPPGFAAFKVDGITLSGGDKRNVNAQLTVGATVQAVEVAGTVDSVAPVDSPEKTNIVNEKQLQNFISVGSNAAEFIKIMPGFGIQQRDVEQGELHGETIGINANGDAGSQSPLNDAYSYNGLPSNSLDITADGAHVSDPGCNCDTPVNPNSDMIERIPGQDVELQRREPERSGGDHFGGQVGRQGFPRFGVLLCAQLRAERQ